MIAFPEIGRADRQHTGGGVQRLHDLFLPATPAAQIDEMRLDLVFAKPHLSRFIEPDLVTASDQRFDDMANRLLVSMRMADKNKAASLCV